MVVVASYVKESPDHTDGLQLARVNDLEVLLRGQNDINVNILSLVTPCEAIVNSRKSVNIPDCGPSKPFGVHSLHGGKHAGVSKRSLHDTDEIRFEIEVGPDTG